MGSRQWCIVSADSWIVTCHPLVGLAIVGEACMCGSQGRWRPLYLLLNFAVNLNFLKRINSIHFRLMYVTMHPCLHPPLLTDVLIQAAKWASIRHKLQSAFSPHWTHRTCWSPPLSRREGWEPTHLGPPAPPTPWPAPTHLEAGQPGMSPGFMDKSWNPGWSRPKKPDNSLTSAAPGLVATRVQGDQNSLHRESELFNCSMLVLVLGWDRSAHWATGSGRVNETPQGPRATPGIMSFVLCAKSLGGVQLFTTPWAVTHQAPLSMEFPRQEYWSGFSCPPPGDLPDPGIKPESLMSPALAGGFFTINTTSVSINNIKLLRQR